MKKRAPWPLARLFKRNRFAPVVYMALEGMASASGSPVVTPTRTRLSELTGITRMATLSAALSALEAANWIHREHVPVFVGKKQTATLLRIVICRRERKSYHTAHGAVESENRSKGSYQKSLQDSLKREGALPHSHIPNDQQKTTTNITPDDLKELIEKEIQKNTQS